jgi:hypothetical protein
VYVKIIQYMTVIFMMEEASFSKTAAGVPAWLKQPRKGMGSAVETGPGRMARRQIAKNKDVSIDSLDQFSVCTKH